MADKDHEHVWVEQGRYIPYTDRDFDSRYQLVEEPRDENGNVVPMDHDNYTTPDPYIWNQCSSCGEQARIKIPKRAYERLRNALQDGSVLPEHISQLPLGELIPEMAGHQAAQSGASRVSYTDTDAGSED